MVKKLILTTLLLASVAFAKGQSKTISTATPEELRKLNTVSILKSNTGSYYYGTPTPVKAWLIVHNPAQDSVILEFHKSQLRWLNDSTAVIYKPKDTPKIEKP